MIRAVRVLLRLIMFGGQGNLCSKTPFALCVRYVLCLPMLAGCSSGYFSPESDPEACEPCEEGGYCPEGLVPPPTASPSPAPAPACPDKEGYLVQADTNWWGSDWTTGGQTSVAEAEEICNLDDNCMAFNDWGYYLVKVSSSDATSISGAGVTFHSHGGMCTYIKASYAANLSPSPTVSSSPALPTISSPAPSPNNSPSPLPACPAKKGYVTYPAVDWYAAHNLIQTREGQTSEVEAEKFCNLEANCMAFNNYGYYIVKLPGSNATTIMDAGVAFGRYDELCIYIKTQYMCNLAPSSSPKLSPSPSRHL